MKMITSTEWLLSFVIPEVVSSVEEQIATLKRTLSKLDMLPGALKPDVSSGMLKYMQSLDLRATAFLKEYILGALTVMELEGLLSLVEYAREQLKKQEYKKSATPYKPGSILRGGLSAGPTTSGAISTTDYVRLLKELQKTNKDKKTIWSMK